MASNKLHVIWQGGPLYMACSWWFLALTQQVWISGSQVVEPQGPQRRFTQQLVLMAATLYHRHGNQLLSGNTGGVSFHSRLTRNTRGCYEPETSVWISDLTSSSSLDWPCTVFWRHTVVFCCGVRFLLCLNTIKILNSLSKTLRCSRCVVFLQFRTEPEAIAA